MILSRPLTTLWRFLFLEQCSGSDVGRSFVPGAFRAKHQTLSPSDLCCHYSLLQALHFPPFHSHTAITLSRSGILRWVFRPLLTPCKTSRTLVDAPHPVIGGSKIASCTSTPVGQWIIGILPHANPSLGPFHNRGFATHDTPLYLRLPTLYKHHYVRRSLHSITIRFSRAGMNRKILVRNPTNR